MVRNFVWSLPVIRVKMPQIWSCLCRLADTMLGLHEARVVENFAGPWHGL